MFSRLHHICYIIQSSFKNHNFIYSASSSPVLQLRISPGRLNAKEDLRISGHAVCSDHKGQLAQFRQI